VVDETVDSGERVGVDDVERVRIIRSATDAVMTNVDVTH